jgi:hypothetical protein
MQESRGVFSKGPFQTAVIGFLSLRPVVPGPRVKEGISAHFNAIVCLDADEIAASA